MKALHGVANVVVPTVLAQAGADAEECLKLAFVARYKPHMHKTSLDRIRQLAAQPAAASQNARNIVARAQQLSDDKLAAVTGGLTRAYSTAAA